MTDLRDTEPEVLAARLDATEARLVALTHSLETIADATDVLCRTLAALSVDARATAAAIRR